MIEGSLTLSWHAMGAATKIVAESALQRISRPPSCHALLRTFLAETGSGVKTPMISSDCWSFLVISSAKHSLAGARTNTVRLTSKGALTRMPINFDWGTSHHQSNSTIALLTALEIMWSHQQVIRFLRILLYQIGQKGNKRTKGLENECATRADPICLVLCASYAKPWNASENMWPRPFTIAAKDRNRKKSTNTARQLDQQRSLSIQWCEHILPRRK